MATTRTPRSPTARTQTSSSSGSPSAEGCLLRLFWILFGHLMLAAFGGLILRRGDFSGLDLAYWATVAVLVAARYVDIARFGGRTSDDDPATLDHFRRFALYLVTCTATAWIGVHAWHFVSAS